MTRIVVGQVEVRYDGDLSLRQLRSLLREVAGVALTVGLATDDEPEEAKPAITLGFTTEIAEPVEPDLSEYFEDEERLA
jgi:hypothetical protein